jgi:hypothetical protein
MSSHFSIASHIPVLTSNRLQFSVSGKEYGRFFLRKHRVAALPHVFFTFASAARIEFARTEAQMLYSTRAASMSPCSNVPFAFNSLAQPC